MKEGGGGTNVFNNRPVVDVVVGKALPGEEVPEELAEVRVVGLVIEAERAGVVEVDGELLREALAERIDLGAQLLLADLLVLLLLGGGPKPLPGEHSTVEVHQYVPEGLEVVPSGLLCRIVEKTKTKTKNQNEIMCQGMSQ